MANGNPPEAGTAENKNAGHGEAEHKPKSTLESVIGELGSFAKKAAAIGVLAAMPFGYNYFDPSHVARAAVTTGAFAASKAATNIIQEKDAFDGVVRNGFNGALLSYPIAEGFKGLNNLEAAIQPSYGTVAAKTAKAAGMALGLQPAVTAGNVALNYGIGKKFRENVWKTIKTGFKLIAIPGILNVNWLYQYGLLAQMAISGGLSFLLNYSQAAGEGKGSIKNLYKELNPFSYAAGAVTGTSKLISNAGKGLTDTIYAFGKTIDGYLSPSAAATKRPETNNTATQGGGEQRP